MKEKLTKAAAAALVDNAMLGMEMYKQGFLDGYLFRRKHSGKQKKIIWKKISEDCRKSFENKFKKIEVKNG